MVDFGTTHNFIIEVIAKRLSLCWKKDTKNVKAVNYSAIPIIRVEKRKMIKLGGWNDFTDFVVVKMDDFDVVLKMNFLLEHQMIPIPLAKYLVITSSSPTVV